MFINEITINYKAAPIAVENKVTSSKNAYDILMSNWDEDIHFLESFVVLHLSSMNKVKGLHRVSKGGLTGTLADTRVIFAAALKNLATAIVLAHNHPSGNLVPSTPDRTLTKKLKEAGDLLDITVLDHLILTPEDGYYSFADEGLL